MLSISVCSQEKLWVWVVQIRYLLPGVLFSRSTSLLFIQALCPQRKQDVPRLGRINRGSYANGDSYEFQTHDSCDVTRDVHIPTRQSCGALSKVQYVISFRESYCMNHRYIFPTRASCGMNHFDIFPPVIRTRIVIRTCIALFGRVALFGAYTLPSVIRATPLYTYKFIIRDSYRMTLCHMNCSQHS